MPTRRKTRIALLLLLTALIVGTVGYHILEGWSLINSIYATVVTLGTVGYGDFAPATPHGRVFAVFLITFGVGIMAYTFTMIMENITEGRLKKVLGKGKLERGIKRMKDHYIICGCGRIGFPICQELAHEKVSFIVIENDSKVIQKIEDEKFYYIKGSATEDKILIAAGIERRVGSFAFFPLTQKIFT